MMETDSRHGCCVAQIKRIPDRNGFSNRRCRHLPLKEIQDISGHTGQAILRSFVDHTADKILKSYMGMVVHP